MTMFHRWVSTDNPEHDSCLICGGIWQVPDSYDISSDHESAYGESATPCTGDTSQVHGYPGERYCEWYGCRDIDGDCPHETYECNCLLCQ